MFVLINKMPIKSTYSFLINFSTSIADNFAFSKAAIASAFFTGSASNALSESIFTFSNSFINNSSFSFSSG